MSKLGDTGPDSVVRDPDLRCDSAAEEMPGRMHYCKLPTDHDPAEHECICGRKWTL